MRRIVSLIGCLALILTLAAATTTVNAAGSILFQDDFSSEDLSKWMWDNTAFICEDGVCKGDPAAVVHQSSYVDGGAAWGVDIAYKVDVRVTDYMDSTEIGPGLWFRDYNLTLEEDEETDAEDGEVWQFQFNYVNQTFKLTSEYLTNNGFEEPTYTLPEGTIKMGPDEKPTTFSMGWRIRSGKIDCYYNDKLIISCTNVPADIGLVRPSPVCLWNRSADIEFDNFILSTADYDLFNEGSIPTDDTTTKAPDDSKVVTKVITDADGNTQVVTEVVADTDKTNPNVNNGGSSTGDMIIAVAAVMIVGAAGAVVLGKRREH